MAETMIGSVGSLLILALVFGSFLAFLPLLIAGVSVLATFLIVGGLTEITGISQIVEFLIALIGLGVAIDYSLLVVSRWREERARGAANADAVASAMTHAGRAVVFSGLTVAIGLLSMIVLPVPMLRSVGYGGVLVPLVSVAVAVTLLPVIIAKARQAPNLPTRLRSDDDRPTPAPVVPRDVPPGRSRPPGSRAPGGRRRRTHRPRRDAGFPEDKPAPPARPLPLATNQSPIKPGGSGAAAFLARPVARPAPAPPPAAATEKRAAPSTPAPPAPAGEKKVAVTAAPAAPQLGAPAAGAAAPMPEKRAAASAAGGAGSSDREKGRGLSSRSRRSRSHRREKGRAARGRCPGAGIRQMSPHHGRS